MVNALFLVVIGVGCGLVGLEAKDISSVNTSILCSAMCIVGSFICLQLAESKK